jgi:hypothetical protein
MKRWNAKYCDREMNLVHYSFRTGKKSKSTYIMVFPGVRKHNKEVSNLRAPMWLDFQDIMKITVSL